MGTWGTAIKDNDAFADVYSEFFEQYNKGGLPDNISKNILEDYKEILEIKEERNSLWFALGLAQWETKSLDPMVLSKIENIVSTGEELKIWLELGADENDIKKRRIAIDKLLEKLKSSRPKAKTRRKSKLKTPIFETGDCLTFRLSNGNYGGAVVLATDNNPETGYNLVATTRLNQKLKPTINDFEHAELLICNFGNWQDRAEVTWYMPDLYYSNYAEQYELIGKIKIDFEYDVKNYLGEGYLFKPQYTSGWTMNSSIDKQLESEKAKPKPTKSLTLKQLTIKNKRWKLW